MRSLVTGGAGFLGSHVTRHCLALGHEVVVLDDLSGGFREQIPAGADFAQGSVMDREFVHQLFERYSFDYVYHLAAYAAEGLSHFIRRFNYQNNLIGSINLINESVNHGVKCFIFTSSIAVYGRGQLPMDEDMEPNPKDPYGIGKLAVEKDLQAAWATFGLPYVILRPHNVYGEGQNIADPYRNVVGIFMNQVLANQPMTIFGDGSQTRAFTYVDDVAPAIAKSAETEAARNAIINVGTDTPYTVNELAHTVADAMGVKARIKYLPPRSEVLHAYASQVKAERLLGMQTTVSLAEGVDRMACWVRKFGVRGTISYSDFEIEKGLPPIWRTSVE